MIIIDSDETLFAVQSLFFPTNPIDEGKRLSRQSYKFFEHQKRYLKWILRQLTEISGVGPMLMGR
jgi:hypothetical protein